MTKMTIDIPDERYKSLKHSAIELGVSIKDYVLDALNLKEVTLTRDDGVKRKLKRSTIKALKESRSGKKLKSFNSSNLAFAYLDKKAKIKKS